MKKLKSKFKKGDKVRISKSKHVIEKGYTPNSGMEIFTVVRVARTRPITYYLKNYKGENIAGGLYEQELAKVKYPDVGFDNSHNSWTNKA